MHAHFHHAGRQPWEQDRKGLRFSRAVSPCRSPFISCPESMATGLFERTAPGVWLLSQQDAARALGQKPARKRLTELLRGASALAHHDPFSRRVGAARPVHRSHGRSSAWWHAQRHYTPCLIGPCVTSVLLKIVGMEASTSFARVLAAGEGHSMVTSSRCFDLLGAKTPLAIPRWQLQSCPHAHLTPTDPRITLPACRVVRAGPDRSARRCPAGITPADAISGQFFYAFAHEMGHAVFDLLAVPVFG